MGQGLQEEGHHPVLAQRGQGQGRRGKQGRRRHLRVGKATRLHASSSVYDRAEKTFSVLAEGRILVVFFVFFTFKKSVKKKHLQFSEYFFVRQKLIHNMVYVTNVILLRLYW